jgi:uncharacterized membrane protein
MMSTDVLILSAMITVVVLSTGYIVHALRGLVNQGKRVEARHLEMARAVEVQRRRRR